MKYKINCRGCGRFWPSPVESLRAGILAGQFHVQGDRDHAVEVSGPDGLVHVVVYEGATYRYEPVSRTYQMRGGIA